MIALKRYYALDAFRGIAASLVFLYHMPNLSILTSNTFITKSGIFVDLFFILSGFVIYHNYKDKTFDVSGSIVFIKKRLKRLVPLHIFTLTVLLALEVFKYASYNYFPYSETPFSSNSWQSFWPQLLLLNSTPFYVDFSWNGPNWSISAELISYIVFVFTSILSFSKKKLSLIFSIGIVILGYLFFYLKYASFDTTIDFNFSFIRGLIGFNLGVCMYMVSHQLKAKVKRSSQLFWSISEIIISVIVIGLVSSINPLIKHNFYIIHSAFAVLILVFSIEGGSMSTLLKHDWFQKIGKWSYSIYLNHIFLISIYQMLVLKLFNLQGISLIVSEILLVVLLFYYSKLTYTYVEKPFYKGSKQS